MKDLMIDIETLSSSNDAVMIQLAGVYFDRNTGQYGSEFCMNIDENSCLAKGFSISDSTLEWWGKQNPEILKAIRTNCCHVETVMDAFYNFYKAGGNSVQVWSHATFDFVIVQNYLEKLKKGFMRHKEARDIRTLVALSGIDLKKYDWNKKTHNALDDCKFQITYCVDAMRMLVARDLAKNIGDNMADTRKLLPCPFCNSKNIKYGKKCLYCEDCGCITGYQDNYDEDGAREAAWNMRAQPQQIQGLKRALEYYANGGDWVGGEVDNGKVAKTALNSIKE